MRHVTQELRDKWTKTARRILVGRKIIEARYDETNLLFLVLDDGTQILPMSDDEGNGPGALHIVDKNDKFEILPTL